MRIVLLIALSILAFGGAFFGVYMSIEPPEQPKELLVPDSLDVGALTDSLGREAWGASLAAQSSLMASLVDSLAISRGRVIAAQARVDGLAEENRELRAAASARESRQEIATGMAATLPKLDQKELTPILDGLDDSSLDDLYQAASTRNRTAILQALQPERASALVERRIAPERTKVAPIAADSTSPN
ncbi:MAG: hypothetical protein ACI9W4_000731 [Rhodothermales bacterium]|jgi:hypothetical protein